MFVIFSSPAGIHLSVSSVDATLAINYWRLKGAVRCRRRRLAVVGSAPRHTQYLMSRLTAERPIHPIRARTLRSMRPRREIERFELLVDESAVMTRTPADGVDGEIETWLGKICLALELDRSGIMSVIRLLILCTLRIRRSDLIFLHFPGISTPRSI
jgi:hypothetical protein